MKLHWKTRNKIFDRLHLWPLVVLQSNIRFKLYPHNPNAHDWHYIARHYHYTYLDAKNYKFIEGGLATNRKVTHIVNTLAKESREDFYNINRYVNKLRGNKKLLYLFVVGLISKLSLNDKPSNDAKIKYLHATYEYFFSTSPYVMNNLLKDIIYENPKTDYQLGDWALGRLENHTFRHVKAEKYEEIYPYCFTNKQTITVLAQNYASAISSTITLPENCKIKFYLIEEITDCKSSNCIIESRQQELEFYNLIQEVVPHYSAIGYDAVGQASELSKRIFNNVEKTLSSLECGYDISTLKKPSELCIEDLILSNVKTPIAIHEIFKNGDDIYFVCNGYREAENRLIDLLQYMPHKNIYISAFSYSGSKMLDPRQRIFSEIWHNEHVKPFLNASSRTEKTTAINQQDISELFAEFKKTNKVITPKDDYIFCLLGLNSFTYAKAIEPVYQELLKNDSIACAYYDVNEKPVKKIIKDMRNWAQKMKRQLYFLPFTIYSFNNRLSEKQNNLFKDLANEIFELSPKNEYVIGGIDYASSIQSGIHSFLVNHLPAQINLRERLLKLFAFKKPVSALLMPARTSFGWVCADVLQEAGIKMLEQQVLFQSSHPRYKPSPANVVGLMNEEQVEIYKSVFPIGKNQKVTKFGSVLFKQVQDMYNNIDVNKVCQKYDLPKDKNIITIATQSDFSGEFLVITSHIAKLAAERDDIFVVVKLHPRENTSYIEAYNKVIKAADCESKCLVTATADMYEVTKASRILITIFSNIGMEAAVLGKDVVIANLNNLEMPVNLAKQGLAMEAKTPDELKDIVLSILGETSAIDLKKSRDSFIKANIEIVDGKVLERIKKYLAA